MNIVLELDNVDTPNVIPYSRNQTTVRIEGPKELFMWRMSVYEYKAPDGIYNFLDSSVDIVEIFPCELEIETLIARFPEWNVGNNLGYGAKALITVTEIRIL